MPVRASATRVPAPASANRPPRGRAHAGGEPEAGTRTETTGRSARTSRRRGRGRVQPVAPPLGSLTQRDHRIDVHCPACGSGHITRLSMNLTDGTPVDFTSCHRCEHKMWQHAGTELSVDGVLDRTRKI